MARLDVIVGEETFKDWGQRTILTSEAIAIEKAYGKNFAQFSVDLDQGSIYAKQVLAWSLLRRHDPGLKLGAVDMPIGDIRLELVCDVCERPLNLKMVDGEFVPGERVHEDDGTDECKQDLTEAESSDPFTPEPVEEPTDEQSMSEG